MWQQGKFIDKPEYKDWSDKDKENAQRCEAVRVRPSPEGNAICTCGTPKDAAWIAKQLNLVEELKQALSGLIQVSSKEELARMELLVRADNTTPNVDKANAINAITALKNALSQHNAKENLV